MRVLLHLLLIIVILGKTSAGPKQRLKKRLGRLERNRNVSRRVLGAKFLRNSRSNGGILKRLDTMDANFASLGVQIADVLENKKHINSQLSKIMNDNLDRDENRDKAFSTMNVKMEEMNQNINSLGLLVEKMLKSMRYMNDTMQYLHTDIKTNIAESLGRAGNRGKLEEITKPSWMS